ncbi:hypothetical protein Tco_0759227 [Tanacetum coccineum]
MDQVHQAAQGFTEDEWEDIRARVEADEELTQKLQAEERDKYSEGDQARMLVDLINQRKRYFAAQKAEAKRNKPMTQAQQRTYMSNYIKHMGSHTMQQLKRYTFDELKELLKLQCKHVLIKVLRLFHQEFFSEMLDDSLTDKTCGKDLHGWYKKGRDNTSLEGYGLFLLEGDLQDHYSPVRKMKSGRITQGYNLIS